MLVDDMDDILIPQAIKYVLVGKNQHCGGA